MTVRDEPRKRGVRLSDLDRERMYVIAFVGRRWEVLGPLDPDGPAGPPPMVAGGGARPEGPPEPAPRGRHAAPEAPADPAGPGDSPE